MSEEARVSMMHFSELSKLGILPRTVGEVRFAVGTPNHLTSNSWKAWANNGDVYLACRDNFRECKVSLHASPEKIARGESRRWRMGFTDDAVKKRSDLIASNQDRAWEVWEEPADIVPGGKIAFHIYFPTSKICVKKEDRKPSKWKEVIFLEAGPTGRMKVVTICITIGTPKVKFEGERCFPIAIFALNDGRCAQIIARACAEQNIQELIARGREQSIRQATQAGIKLPKTSFAYFFGNKGGARFIVGARAFP